MVLLDATRNHHLPLTVARIKGWQAALFPAGYSGLTKITAGEFRKSRAPMQVVSGPVGREQVHDEAPPSDRVPVEIKTFFAWWKASGDQLDGLVRAAVAHFWFVTIHPFEDGNGRVARAIADMALAQDENTGCRLYSMSAQINTERDAYYRELEKAQRGDGNITGWILWFLTCLERAVTRSEEQVRMAVKKAEVWRSLAATPMNTRQRKAVNRLLDGGPDGFEGGLTNRKYRAMTATTPETAKRDLAQLVGLGILVRAPGGGRSVRYSLNL
ncbi:MAG: Fic family protein [Lentisphaeria bacterium]